MHKDVIHPRLSPSSWWAQHRSKKKNMWSCRNVTFASLIDRHSGDLSKQRQKKYGLSFHFKSDSLDTNNCTSQNRQTITTGTGYSAALESRSRLTNVFFVTAARVRVPDGLPWREIYSGFASLMVHVKGGSAQRSHWVRDTGDKRRIRSRRRKHRWQRVSKNTKQHWP